VVVENDYVSRTAVEQTGRRRGYVAGEVGAACVPILRTAREQLSRVTDLSDSFHVGAEHDSHVRRFAARESVGISEPP
jgi:hypothetical protein